MTACSVNPNRSVINPSLAKIRSFSISGIKVYLTKTSSYLWTTCHSLAAAASQEKIRSRRHQPEKSITSTGCGSNSNHQLLRGAGQAR